MKKIIIKELLHNNSVNWHLKMSLSIFLLVFTFGNIQANTYSDNTEIILEQTEITGTVTDASDGQPCQVLML